MEDLGIAVTKRVRRNDEIEATEVRVIGSDGEQAGVMGIAAALPFFVWIPLGWVQAVPSIVDVFGIPGLRYPAGITIGGLLVAAICFYDA